MASYSFKKEDLDKPKDDTGLKFPKGIRHEKRMIEEERKNIANKRNFITKYPLYYFISFCVFWL